MKKLLLTLAIVLVATSSFADTFRATAKNTLFVPVDGPGYCNGIKIYDGKKFLFNLGWPECPSKVVVHGRETDLRKDSYDDVVALAQQLTTYVKKIDGNTTIEFNTWLFDEDFPGAFIKVVQ